MDNLIFCLNATVPIFAIIVLGRWLRSKSFFTKQTLTDIDRLSFKVLLPILKPVMITNLIIAAIGIWNNFQVPLYLMSSSKRTTIPMMIFNFYGLYSRNWNYVFAALVITVLPIVILYLALQKYIIEGMTAGAVKG